MNAPKQIIMTVDKAGEIKIETQGFNGPSCIQESEYLKAALGTELCRDLTVAHFNQEQGINTKQWLPLCG